MESSARLIEQLCRPGAFPHPVDGIRIEETHISWVLLTGDYAYKIKKPVNFGFLDFSTLARRDHCCREELRLNRRLAPELYLDVVRITESPTGPVVAGEGDPVEMAVQMRQFDPAQQLDRVLARGDLSLEDLETVGLEVADFHARAPAAEPADSWGDPEAVLQPIVENFAQVRGAAADLTDIEAPLQALEAAARADHAARIELLRRRRDDGRVRECHGDLHLSNLARLETGIRAFDCIEFNPSLRWIDVCSDVAFLFMDLLARQRRDMAWRFLNAWLRRSGDYEALALLPLYAAYRSMVRVKVAALQRTQQDDAGARDALEQRLRAHLALAQTLQQSRDHPPLVLVGGLSGSGKSWLARQLADALGAVHLRSDVERKRLFGLAELENSDPQRHPAIYGPQAGRRTYERLRELARQTLDAGQPVIVDATFLDGRRRHGFIEMGRARGSEVRTLWCEAPEPVLRERLRERQARGDDASEADMEVMLRQAARVDRPSEGEALVLDTAEPGVLERALGALAL